MSFEITRATAAEILPLREQHRQEMRCQIVHDSLHERGFTHPYLIRTDGRAIGYGTVVGFGEEAKETVDEFFLVMRWRRFARRLFAAFVEASAATRVQAQTNDRLLTLMLLDFATDLRRDRILFEDVLDTDLTLPELVFRRRSEVDAGRAMDGTAVEELGDWVLDDSGEIVGAGGILLHYNPPYGDLHMAVAEGRRRRGYGSFLVQELKRECRAMGKIPAARCDADNHASRATLERAGMLPCAGIVTGVLRRGAEREAGDV